MNLAKCVCGGQAANHPNTLCKLEPEQVDDYLVTSCPECNHSTCYHNNLGCFVRPQSGLSVSEFCPCLQNPPKQWKSKVHVAAGSDWRKNEVLESLCGAIALGIETNPKWDFGQAADCICQDAPNDKTFQYSQHFLDYLSEYVTFAVSTYQPESWTDKRVEMTILAGRLDEIMNRAMVADQKPSWKVVGVTQYGNYEMDVDWAEKETILQMVEQYQAKQAKQ